MRYAPPRSAPGAARDGTTDKCTHICICNDGTGVCARAPHAQRRGWGVGALAYDELAVKLFEALFFFAPSKGLHPRLHAHPTPVTYDGTPYPTILDKHPPNCGQQHPFSWPRLRRCFHGRSGLHFCCKHRKRYGYLCTVDMSVSVHNNIPGRSSLSPPSLCPMGASLVIWPQILGALFLRP